MPHRAIPSTTRPAFNFRRLKGTHGSRPTTPSSAPAAAQAHIPPTELVEMVGFTGTCAAAVRRSTTATGPQRPATGSVDGSRNEPIRQTVVQLLNASSAYRQLFCDRVPRSRSWRAHRLRMFARAIAEFEFTLTFADAPVDRFARGDTDAMTDCPEARRPPVLRQGRLRALPLRRGRVERDVQRLRDARRRRSRRSRPPSASGRAM